MDKFTDYLGKLRIKLDGSLKMCSLYLVFSFILEAVTIEKRKAEL